MLTSRFGALERNSNWNQHVRLLQSPRALPPDEPLLHGFAGVLVTDFYPAYDSMGCAQQKCLVHLIRDLNAGLLENPFDEEFKHFAFEFGRLLRSIVTTIDGHGLRRSHLAKHRREVDHFGSSVFKCGTAGFSRSNGSFRPLFALKNGRTIIFTGM